MNRQRKDPKTIGKPRPKPTKANKPPAAKGPSIEDLVRSNTALCEKLDDAETEKAELYKETEDLKGELTALSSVQKMVIGKLDSVTVKQLGRIDELNQTIEDMSANFDELNQTLEDMSANFHEYKKTVAKSVVKSSNRITVEAPAMINKPRVMSAIEALGKSREELKPWLAAIKVYINNI